MTEPKLTVTSFTVSWAFDTHRGQKQSHFVSAAVQSDIPISVEELPLVQLRVARQVSSSAIRDAVCRQSMTIDEAASYSKEIQENFDNMESSLKQKMAVDWQQKQNFPVRIQP